MNVCPEIVFIGGLKSGAGQQKPELLTALNWSKLTLAFDFVRLPQTNYFYFINI